MKAVKSKLKKNWNTRPTFWTTSWPKPTLEKQGLMPALEQNYIEKHRSTNLTADALTKAGIGVLCAGTLHKTS